MQIFYRLAADAVVVAHFAYVAFILVGFLLTVVGAWRKWQWVRNFKFRALHLFAILVVVAESICGITCPLTVWEQDLRELAGQASYQGDFIATWVHELLFYEADPWVFTVSYALFGCAVLATFLFAPPRWKAK